MVLEIKVKVTLGGGGVGSDLEKAGEGFLEG